jgi:hypothetical protein
MTVEYIFLGGLLIVMGAVQTWLRHGPGAKALDEADRSRRPAAGQQPTRGGVRSGRVWQSWTSVLGGISVVLGIVLVVMGIMGR